MITKYYDFVNENNSKGITPEEKELLEKYKITDFKFNPETNLIDVYQNVDLRSITTNDPDDNKTYDLPKIRFGVIYDPSGYGGFYCQNNYLTSLKYCPKEIKGELCLDDNLLTSLEFCPKSVGSFACCDNKLTSLKGCPDIVNGIFICDKNQKLKNLDHCPKEVYGTFCCDINIVNQIEKNLDLYPVCIIHNGIDNFYELEEVCDIVKENRNIFLNLLDDKIKFHQMIMRLDSSLIKYYKDIPPPSQKSTLLV